MTTKKRSFRNVKTQMIIIFFSLQRTPLFVARLSNICINLTIHDKYMLANYKCTERIQFYNAFHTYHGFRFG